MENKKLLLDLIQKMDEDQINSLFNKILTGFLRYYHHL